MIELLGAIVDNRGTIQYALILGLCVWAFAQGDAPERWAGTVLSAAVLAAVVVSAFGQPDDYRGVILVYLIGDSLVFLALIPLAMRANRIYPIWLLAAQLIAVAMHFQRELVPGIHPLAYFVLVHGPSWVQVAAFAAGMTAHRRRIARFGSYRSWKRSLRR